MRKNTRTETLLPLFEEISSYLDQGLTYLRDDRQWMGFTFPQNLGYLSFEGPVEEPGPSDMLAPFRRFARVEIVLVSRTPLYHFTGSLKTAQQANGGDIQIRSIRFKEVREAGLLLPGMLPESCAGTLFVAQRRLRSVSDLMLTMGREKTPWG